MVEELRGHIEQGFYKEARILANQLVEQGENSEVFWILNAALYQIEGVSAAEFACISRGLQVNPSNYELYFMLGNYYRERNLNQAYLCYEQALYYCKDENDAMLIKEQLDAISYSGKCEVHPASIVVLSYNIVDILKGCIESIRANNPESAYELVVVDNASTDGAAEWLKEQKDIVLTCNTENKGFARGCNQGIKMASPDNDIMLLNNDTIVPPNALFWLRMGLYERETVGAVGPLTNCAANNQMLMQQFETKEEYFELARSLCIPQPGPYENKVWLVGFAMLIKRRALDDVGLLDSRYEWGNYEDNDYGMKLSAAGYELLLCYNSYIYHYGSLNMGKDKDKYAHYIEENKQKFIEKWGCNISYYSGARQDIIGFIEDSRNASINILEVGCGCGATLARIKYLFPNARVYGIEIQPEVARVGTYLADIVVGNIETMQLPYDVQMFDYIIFGDVLEHLREPENVVKRMKQYLKPSGKVIASVPNIMNISVLVALLKGRFRYYNNGLLDRTHIHFFTRGELEKMFEECGLEVQRLHVHFAGEHLTDEDNELIEAIYQLPGIADIEQFQVYQYIAVARLKEGVKNGRRI